MADISKIKVNEKSYDLADSKARNDINGVNVRVDNIVANSTTTEGNTELIDIRTGANGTTYNTAGEAVRGQFEEVNDKLGTVATLSSNVNELDTTVELLSETVTEASGVVTQYDKRLTNVESDITQLESDITQLESDITQLESDVSTLNSNKQNKNWQIIGVSNNGSAIYWDLSNYSELIIVGVKSNTKEVVSNHYDASLIINNDAIYWFGTMVAQAGLVFKVVMNKDALAPQWCFSNSHNSDLNGTVIYAYAR